MGPARRVWSGWVISAGFDGIVRFILWRAVERSVRFIVALAGAFGFAIILGEVGVGQVAVVGIVTLNSDLDIDIDESVVCVNVASS